ncbi:rRNA methyltransferase 2, mitochondrial isoform X1 [Leptopilina heterotoma]|uniref:rRNA methyltransferase 2, mitochondrial isoform X1 n=1 Tax=Leptopilina heterotoma TaxID=63436 RepID=UPI001CA8517E|nr:rRNA methyltransferase 2, mitochondrial isoform X1 [Leptopilina heterotoma]
MQFRQLHTCCRLLKEGGINVKGKKHSSNLWLERQRRDPYVEKSKKENYRCRSAFKLLEINERFNILFPGMVVVDCGAAPGSWTQVAVKLTNANGAQSEEPKGLVFAIDRQIFQPIEGAVILGNSDFTLEKTHEKLRFFLNGSLVDLVMSDMAPNASGVKKLDHDVIIELSYSALKFALQFSKPGSSFLTKIWAGGKTNQLYDDLTKYYKSVKNVRPKATRDDSSEEYLLAKDFRGLKSG